MLQLYYITHLRPLREEKNILLNASKNKSCISSETFNWKKKKKIKNKNKIL